MKVLFVGDTRSSSTALHYYSAMIRVGCDVLPFNPGFFEVRHLPERVFLALKKAPIPFRVRRISDEFVRILKKNQFDLIFVVSENFLGFDSLEEARKSSRRAPLFLYHSHDNNFSPGILKPKDFEKTLAAYDFVFTTKAHNVAVYKSLGVSQCAFLPSAFDPSIHRPIPDEDSSYGSALFDVSFVGTYAPCRDPVIKALETNQVRIWGNGWSRSPHFRTKPKLISDTSIYYYELADVISHTKCSLGLLRQGAGDFHTQRTFEIPACGSLQFAPRNDEILSFFKEDQEIICYASLEELTEKVAFYLRHDPQRAKIASAGYDRVVRDNHTYLNRVSMMLDRVKHSDLRHVHFR